MSDFCGMGKLPRMPTTALPGTEEKIQAMAARVKRKETLFHPDDAVWGEPGANLLRLFGIGHPLPESEYAKSEDREHERQLELTKRDRLNRRKSYRRRAA